MGKLENDLLTRLILCVDPRSEAVSGLKPKVLRSLGLDTETLTQAEMQLREARRTKIRAELMRGENLLNGPGRIPGLPMHEGSEYAVPIPFAGLSIITEKIVRGCEFRFSKRYVETPYGIRTFICDSAEVPAVFAPYLKTYDLGPGCRIKRLATTEDPNAVRYWFTVWGTLHLRAIIDFEEYLLQIQEEFCRPEGITRPEDRRMAISSYLRNLPEANEGQID